MRHLSGVRLWVAACLSVLVLGLAGCPTASHTRSTKTGVDQEQLSSGLVDKLKDAVVMIEVTLTVPGGGTQEQSGSGFLLSDQGQLVTNNHVVALLTETEDGSPLLAESRDVKVVFHAGTPDEKSVPARVVRENRDLDLALLRIDMKTPNYLELADSDKAIETSRVYACGHPLGLKEISIRSGTVTAHRTWENRKVIEHDAPAEQGNSGGPVVDEQGRVIGVHTMAVVSKLMNTQFAIPSNVVRDWLASDPRNDPVPPKPGDPIRELLTKAELKFNEIQPGVFALPYDNNVTVMVHEVKDFLRVFVPLDELPGGSETAQGDAALRALHFNYGDPVGRLSVREANGKLDLAWECQVPQTVATGDYVKRLADMGATQVDRWRKTLAGQDAGKAEDLYPGGDDDELRAQLKKTLDAAGLKYEVDGKIFKLPYDNDVTVRLSLYRGMAYVHCYTGGMPGQKTADKGQIAIKLLQRNWEDPFGRLSLDKDQDLCWEAQVPPEFLTSDYLAILAGTCANQVAGFLKEYGKVPINGR